MNIGGRLAKAEVVIYSAGVRGVACAWHALAALYPSEPKDAANIFFGGCHECGGEMQFNAEGTTEREREIHAELYGVGCTMATLTASRRSWASLLWLGRRGTKLTAGPGETYKQALIEEAARRDAARWEAHLETVSDETLEMLASEDFRDMPDAELEAILWPG